MTRCENTLLQTVANADNAGFSRATNTVTRKFNRKSGIIHVLVNEASEVFSNNSCIISTMHTIDASWRNRNRIRGRSHAPPVWCSTHWYHS